MKYKIIVQETVLTTAVYEVGATHEDAAIVHLHNDDETQLRHRALNGCPIVQQVVTKVLPIWEKGDEVKICTNGDWVIGTIVSADNMEGWSSQKENWYIQLAVINGTVPPGLYYWKQVPDGGTIQSIAELEAAHLMRQPHN